MSIRQDELVGVDGSEALKTKLTPSIVLALIFAFIGSSCCYDYVFSCNLCILGMDNTYNWLIRAQLRQYFHFLLSVAQMVVGCLCFRLWPPLHCVDSDTLLECCSLILQVVKSDVSAVSCNNNGFYFFVCVCGKEEPEGASNLTSHQLWSSLQHRQPTFFGDSHLINSVSRLRNKCFLWNWKHIDII